MNDNHLMKGSLKFEVASFNKQRKMSSDITHKENTGLKILFYYNNTWNS